MEEEQIQIEQPIEEQAQIEQPVEEPQQPSKINIEGLGEFTAEEIKEFKQGYMRQSDYTRKTQEIAKQRKEIEELRNKNVAPTQSGNPYAQTQQDPVMQRIQQLEETLADQELNKTINDLKSKYSDFDEVKVLNEAYERGVTDLEFVYKATREASQPDVATLREQIKAEIMAEINGNKEAVGGSIIGSENTFTPSGEIQLSQAEMAMAKKMGLTPEEYHKYK